MCIRRNNFRISAVEHFKADVLKKELILYASSYFQKAAKSSP
jgi:hypothetical protein